MDEITGRFRSAKWLRPVDVRFPARSYNPDQTREAISGPSGLLISSNRRISSSVRVNKLKNDLRAAGVLWTPLIDLLKRLQSVKSPRRALRPLINLHCRSASEAITVMAVHNGD